MPRCLPASATLAELEADVVALANGLKANTSESLARQQLIADEWSVKNAAELTSWPTSGNHRAQAKLIVAREYGFVTWKQFRRYCQMVLSPQNDSEKAQAFEFLQLACLNYTLFDSPARRLHARRLLRDDSSLATQDIFHAAAVGHVEAVARFLADDKSLVHQRGGYFDWQPLLYACYSRLDHPEYSTLEVARLLIEKGADPNAFYMWGGQYRFTALTGIFGEGESGPINLPEHQHCIEMARLLLDAGADPNDGQALYNRMFEDHESHCLKLLLENGLGPDGRCNWLLQQDGELVANPQQTLQYQLQWAVKHNQFERVRLLVESGADLEPLPGKDSIYEQAMLAGHSEIADYLVEHGANKTELSLLSQFAAACMRGDADSAHDLLASHSQLVEQLQREHPEFLHQAASANNLAAMDLLIDLGANVDQVTRNTPMHEAAWSGHIEMVQLLLDKGANPRILDHSHLATPLQWAVEAGKSDVAQLLARSEIDIFDAVVAANTHRIMELIDDDPRCLETTLKKRRRHSEELNDDWKTPLAVAALKGIPSVVRVLLERNARVDLVDEAGRSLLELVESESVEEVVSLIRSAVEKT